MIPYKKFERKTEKPLFHASSCGKLMTDGKESGGLTDIQQTTVNILLERKKEAQNGLKKPLSKNQEIKLKTLLEKQQKKWTFGATALAEIRDIGLHWRYGIKKQAFTDPLEKGSKNEEKGVALLRYKYGGWFNTNTQRRNNDLFTGHTDIELMEGDKVKEVHDIKCSFDLVSFGAIPQPVLMLGMERGQYIKWLIKTIGKVYFYQLQCYMILTGAKIAKLHYCLTETDRSMLSWLEYKLCMRFGGNEENEDYIKAADQLYANHDISKVPPIFRVKTFVVPYCEKSCNELIRRAKIGQEMAANTYI